MKWYDAEPGDLVEYRIPGCRKRYGLYLGVRTISDDMGITKWLDILNEEHEAILLAVSLDDIVVSVRSSLKDSLG